MLWAVRKLEQWLAVRAGERYPYQSYAQIKISLDEKEIVLIGYRKREKKLEVAS